MPECCPKRGTNERSTHEILVDHGRRKTSVAVAAVGARQQCNVVTVHAQKATFEHSSLITCGEAMQVKGSGISPFCISVSST